MKNWTEHQASHPSVRRSFKRENSTGNHRESDEEVDDPFSSAFAMPSLSTSRSRYVMLLLINFSPNLRVFRAVKLCFTLDGGIFFPSVLVCLSVFFFFFIFSRYLSVQ